MIDRRQYLRLSAGLLTATTLGLGGGVAVAKPPSVPVVDLHVDLSYQLNYRGRATATGSGQWLASELVGAGVNGVVLPLYIPHEVSPTGPRLSDLERSYVRLSAELAATPPYASPGTMPAHRPVRTWLALEGAAPFAERPETLAPWVARGLRVVGLVHAHDNALATSSGVAVTPRRVTTGLSPAGRAVVEVAMALGIVTDLSHASDATVSDVVAMARAAHRPVVATHSNARALAAHPRNLTDAQARAIAETGGVIGVNFHGAYLVVGRRATLDDVVRHVRHLVDVAGTEHVALGSDFEGGIRTPPGLEDVRGLPRLGEAMVASGLTQVAVERVFAGNARRVLGATGATR